LAPEPSIETIESFDDWDNSLLSTNLQEFADDAAMLVDDLESDDTPVTKKPELKKKAPWTTSSVCFNSYECIKLLIFTIEDCRYDY
jgi:hypothetical protein